MAESKHMAKTGQRFQHDQKPAQEDVGKRGWIKMVIALVADFVVTLGSGFLLILINTPFANNPTLGAAVGRIAASVAILIVFLLLGGRPWVGMTGKGLAYTFRRAWPLLLVGIVPSGITFFKALTGSGLPDGFLSSLATTALLCVGIGIMEEYLFRGIQLNALLAGLGGWRWGVFASVIISSIMFGWAHVAQENVTESAAAIQSILKIVQSGMFGIVLAETCLHTHEIGSAAVFHALNDFIMLSASVALQGGQAAGSYVNTNQTTDTYIVYAVMIAVFLLPTIRAIRTIWTEHQTCRGAFME